MSFDFIGYDTEASGLRTATDQPVQKGFVKLDHNLNVVDTLNVLIALNSYTVPGPRAMEVTELSPKDLLSEDRISEFEAAGRVADILSDDRKDGKRLFFTYNGLSYDEELLRYFLFRNLRRPYMTSGKASRRLDLYPAFQYLHFVRPGIVKHGYKANGDVSWRLTDVIEANNVQSQRAHDAVGDTLMTTDLMLKFMNEAPDIFWQCVELSNKFAVGDTLSRNMTEESFVMQFSHFGMPEIHPLAPMAKVGHKGHKVLCVDLSVSPREWMHMSADEVRANIYRPDSPFKVVKPNACPFVFDRHDRTLKGALDRHEYRNEYEAFEKRAQYIRSPEMVELFRQIAADMEVEAKEKFSGRKTVAENELYGTFVPRADENLCKMFCREESWQERAKLAAQMKDHRVRTFAHRIIAMLGPDDVQSPESCKALREQLELRMSEDAGVAKDILTFTGARAEFDELSDDNLRVACAEMLDGLETEMRHQAETLKDLETELSSEGPGEDGDEIQMSLFT